jgi:hypothetical protein
MKSALGILGLCLLGQGCGPLASATRNLVIDPIHYCQTVDDILEHHRDYKLAADSWETIAKVDPGHTYSPDYVKGFKDGFADYLYAGGSGEPPPLPPRYYWKARYETAEGHQAIQDWFAGYRLGAAVAQESGYREWVTIPSSLPQRNAVEPLPTAIITEIGPLPADEPVLPPPHKIAP